MSLILIALLLANGGYLTGASAVFEKDITRISIGRDLSWKTSKDISILILNYRGREKFGNLMEKYDKEGAEITIKEAKTIKKNGEELIPEKKAIGDLSTVEASIAPKYTHSRMKTIAYSAVEQGSRIIYRSVKTGKEKKKYIFGSKVFQKDEPVVHAELSIDSPVKLKYYVIGEVAVKSLIEVDGNPIYFYTFTCESLPKIKNEPSRVAISELSPRVYFTSFKSWQIVWKWLKDKFYSPIQTRGDLAKKAKEMTRGLSEEDEIKAIYNYLTKTWRDIPLTIQDAGFKPTKANEVYKQKYADNKDKCLLLISMLKSVGIEAFPGYVAQEMIEDLPSPEYFYHMVVVLEFGNKHIFLDPTFPEKVSFGVHLPSILANYNGGFPLTTDITGRDVFVVKPDTFLFSKIPLPGPEGMSSEIEFSFDLDQEGNINGSINGTLSGISAIMWRRIYKDKTEKEREIRLKGAVSGIKSGTRLKDWKIENLREPLKDVKFSADLEAPRYAVLQGNRMRIDILPYLFFDSFDGYFSLSKREYYLDIKTPRAYLYILNFKLPNGYKPFYTPEPFAYRDSLLSLITSVKIEGASLKATKEVRLFKRRYSPEEYKVMTDRWSEFAKPERGLVIIEKK